MYLSKAKIFFCSENENCIKPSEYLQFRVGFENVGKIEVQSPCVVPSETETFYQQSCIVRGGKNAVGVHGRPARASNAL